VSSDSAHLFVEGVDASSREAALVWLDSLYA
jgi:hypothetical protein